MHNLLLHPLITAAPLGRRSLPGLMADLSTDSIDHFPALRPHQVAFWHMFLVQLGALAMVRAGRTELPTDEETWRVLLRALTPDHPEDEPWCLVVDDRSKPAFLQPAVPEGVLLGDEIETADGLDLMVTARNHDIKHRIAWNGSAEDFVLALVTGQTADGYASPRKYGIARMNRGYSSRVMLSLAPIAPGKSATVRPGKWFGRDMRILLETRERVLCNSPLYSESGIGLTWLAPWPEGQQLLIEELDIWFIEVCRRIRLQERKGRIVGLQGDSMTSRIAGKRHKGNLSDPWAPVSRQRKSNGDDESDEPASLTLREDDDFDYERLTEILLSGKWTLPLLAYPGSFEGAHTPLAIVAMAVVRGQGKTGGYRSRIVPIDTTRTDLHLSEPLSRERLRILANGQIEAIALFSTALCDALAMVAAFKPRSEEMKRTKEKAGKTKNKSAGYAWTRPARAQLGQFADSIFFAHLWRRFDADVAGPEAQRGEDLAFARRLWDETQTLFEQHLPVMPCKTLFRPCAEARARRILDSRAVRTAYPELFIKDHAREVAEHA